jgi:uncharacterized protein (TIGR00730 family)
MPAIGAVTVYCASSSNIAAAYVEAARALARGIAEAGWTLVYGGNHVGLMAAVADAARGAGGRVVGITPQLLHDRGVSDAAADELVVTPSMRERKAMLEARGDALVALPGGLGTFEEIAEVVVGKQLGYHAKPIVLVDVDGYYQPLLTLLEHGIELGFIKASARGLVHVAATAADAIEYLRHVSAPPPVAAGLDGGAATSAVE